MPEELQLEGMQFGKLKVISKAENILSKTTWRCRCSCGVIVENVQGTNLVQGLSKSCGCSRGEHLRTYNTKHGMTGTKVYRSWRAMMSRCFNVSSPKYYRYGGRGISVCERWRGEHGFENFLADMGLCPAGTSIDRFPNNDGNYEPGNCRWATVGEQNNNRHEKIARPLVLIKSCHRYFARRSAQRATWLLDLQWDHRFIVGGPVLSEENVLHFPISDSFSDIAPKIKAGLSWGVQQGYTHFFICDDDTFVVPSRLGECGFLNFGRHLGCSGFLRTGWFFDGTDHNFPYLQGSAFWLSRQAATIVSKSSAMVNGIIDDGAVGRAIDGKIDFVHDKRYWPGPNCELIPLPENDIISTHKALPDMMHRLHAPWRKK